MKVIPIIGPIQEEFLEEIEDRAFIVPGGHTGINWKLFPGHSREYLFK